MCIRDRSRAIQIKKTQTHYRTEPVFVQAKEVIQAVEDMATRSGRDASPKKEGKEEVITYDNYLKVSSPFLTPL